jgi:hypothetical protein
MLAADPYRQGGGACRLLTHPRSSLICDVASTGARHSRPRRSRSRRSRGVEAAAEPARPPPRRHGSRRDHRHLPRRHHGGIARDYPQADNEKRQAPAGCRGSKSPTTVGVTAAKTGTHGRRSEWEPTRSVTERMRRGRHAHEPARPHHGCHNSHRPRLSPGVMPRGHGLPAVFAARP